MTDVFIIHGAYGNPQENWYPWLKSELERLNCNVFVPRFPTPTDQTLDNWQKIFATHKARLDENTIIIGHSLGAAFLLRVLEDIKTQIKAAFFISGFTENLNNPVFDEINKTFIDKRYDWDRIKKSSKRFYVFHSDNDPYIALKQGKNMAQNLGAEMITIKGAGHFNENSGYKKFPELLEKIKNEL
ncbi:MAG: alpha/beta hydrolase [archaeon]